MLTQQPMTARQEKKGPTKVEHPPKTISNTKTKTEKKKSESSREHGHKTKTKTKTKTKNRINRRART
jgi:hypothetical protein